MLISDLNYLESALEDLAVEGAGESRAFVTFIGNVRAQREAYFDRIATLDVEAVGPVKYINFFSDTIATAYV